MADVNLNITVQSEQEKTSSTTNPDITMKPKAGLSRTAKQQQLSEHMEFPDNTYLTSNQGVKINDDTNTLKLGSRGPSLLEDHLFREKIMHFDHERIPERVVHARGTGAHGYFVANDNGSKYCKAHFLQPGVKTPVFVRFSTVQGSRGSTDVARDARGFATKFYTQEGIFDLVGNNIPVFFIQDGIKFPDFVHSLKPEPHNEIPQAQSAHDTLWDFVSLSTEASHMILWVMSDRAIPRSYRMMEGFGVHTFRLIDKNNTSRFVKFHWKPVLGTHALLWDEALKISGVDPDFHRRDLYDAIENGQYPEYELGIQVIEEQDELKFDFDLLDPTKIVPEEEVKVEIIGKLTLTSNPDNFFAETEQVAFCISHIVPGIDFTNDPLLQARLFSYPDTQLKRLGGPNFHEIPINRPINTVHNNQRDGHMRQQINIGRSSYHPNSTANGCPFQAGLKMGGFVSYHAKINKNENDKYAEIKLRHRSKSFLDHFSQATLFWNSQTNVEKEHIISAFVFELSKCENPIIRERMIGVLQHVSKELASAVAKQLGIKLPISLNNKPLNHLRPADANEEHDYEPIIDNNKNIGSSPALSMIKDVKYGINGRKVAILAADGCDMTNLKSLMNNLQKAGAIPQIISTHGGVISDTTGESVKVDHLFFGARSVLFDSVYVLGGKTNISTLQTEPLTVLFIAEMYKHCKAIGASDEGIEFVKNCLRHFHIQDNKLFTSKNGFAMNPDANFNESCASFIDAMSYHKCWNRPYLQQIVV